MTVIAGGVRVGWRQSADRIVRRLAAATVAGAVLGLLVGGVGGRLAMLLLAALNPEAAGVTSDDGFIMGRFTFSGTLSLLVVGTVIGILGGGIYFVLRGLLIGPRWFKILSISGAAAVVVGSLLVHVDGVDFTLLHPTWLAIALFVTIPGVYAALLTMLTERWLTPGGRLMRTPRWAILVSLLLWVPLLPIFVVLAVIWAIGEYLRQFTAVRELLAHPLIPWTARLALTAIFTASVVDLTGVVATLT